MKKFINDYLINLRPYKTVSQEIWSMNPKEKDRILKLDWNESTIEPAHEVKEAMLEFLNSENFLRLYPATYHSELMQLLSQYAGIPQLNLQYFGSSDSLQEYFSKLFIQPGDKVLILWPSYDNFRSTAEVNGARIVYSEMGTDFQCNLEKLEADINRETPKIVYICNPNNPTGSFLEKEQLKKMIAHYPNTLFLVDEAYAEFAGQSINDLVLMFDNLCVSHTMSKAFGLANVRFGYLAASEDIIEAISRIRNPKNISTLTQVAVISALKNVDYMWNYVKEVTAAREWLIEKMRSDDFSEWLCVYPSRSNFILVKCCDMNIKSKIYYSLRDHQIYVRQLSQSTSLLNCIRITIGTRQQMERVYKVLKDTLFMIKGGNLK